MFTVPMGGRYRVRGATAVIAKTGTPTGELRFRIYQGTTLLGTTTTIPQGTIVTPQWMIAYLTTPITLIPGLSYRLVIGVTTGGTSANYFRLYNIGIHDNATSKALGVFGGSWKKTYSTDGSSWTETDTLWPMIGMVLDSDQEVENSGCRIIGG
jgi:hypothetical protein